MKKVLSTLIVTMLIMFLASCSSKQPYYKSSEGLDQTYSNDKIDSEIYLIGDIGIETNGIQSGDLVAMIKEQLSPDMDNETVVFLGNTLSASGLPDEETKEYADLSKNIGDCINELNKATKNLIFLPGNHEWYDGNSHTVEGVQASEDFIQGLAGGKNIFKPGKGCGEPSIVKINKDLILVLVDSQWLLQSDANNERRKSSCDIDNNLEFITFMQELVAKNKRKNIVIAMHHPVFANGKVGGNYPIKNHLLPLPILGTAITSVKKIIGSPQQFGNPDYEAFRSTIQTGILNCEGCITVSGHDNSLQYFTKNGNHFAVAGSGSKVSFVKKADGAEFSSMSQGFVKIVHTTDLELWLEFYGVDTNSKKIKLLYRKLVHKKVIENFEDQNIYKPKEDYPKTITTKASDRYGKWKFLRGKFYRDAWRQDIEVPLLWLDDVAGGLKPIKQGGGFQTNSLRLENSEGVQFVLRSVKKDVEKVVPPTLRKSVVQNLIQDGIAASHPYGALVIPKLAEAAKIYHATPKVVYLPHQEALGEYNTEFSEGLYLFEERPGGNVGAHKNYGGTQETLSTLELADLIVKSPKHKIDKEITLRSRLFDMWIGDWDRHEDQWRWGIFEDGDNILYRPIPRDRDQVFFKNDGVLDYVASRPFFNPVLRRFKNKIDFFPGLIFSGRYFDRTFLNDLQREDFLAIAEELEASLTDQVINEAFRDWPAEIQKLNAEEIKKILRVRRTKIKKYAGDWYDYIYKEVTVPGTNKLNYFEVEYLEGDKLNLVVYSKEKSPENILYKNTLHGNITKELRLFGLKKKDYFSIKGNHNSSIKIRIIGGSGEDVITNESKNGNVLVYDRPDGVTVTGPFKSHLKNEKGINRYNRLDWQQNRFFHFPTLGFYTDEGVGLTYNVWWKKFGFRSDPYEAFHKLTVSYFPTNSAVVANYTGHFPKAIGNWDFELNAFGVGTAFFQRYYGLGNEFIEFEDVFPTFEDAGSGTFHNVNGVHIDINPGFVKKIWKSSTFTINPSFELFNIDDEVDPEPGEERFFLQPEANLTPNDFEVKYYAGLGIKWATERINNPVIPTRGFRFSMFADYKLNLTETEFSNLTLGTELITYIPFNQSKTLVLAMHLGAAYTYGDTEFFHANYLGGSTRLRGFRTNRFAGDGIVYHANDLRLKLFSGKGAFPLSLGVFGSFDYGRAFLDEVDEVDTWHTSVGGGIFLTPLDILGLRFGIFQGESDTSVSIGGALAF